MRAEIIIPYYNEVHRLEETLALLDAELKRNKVIAESWQLRFWWADDGSTDGSSDKLEEVLKNHIGSNVENVILRNTQNQGKGSAMRRAIEALRERVEPTSIVAFWDSDGELHPRALYEGLNMMVVEDADIIFGSRFSKRNEQVLNFRHYLGNKALTLLSNYFSNLNLSDVHCCARIMRADILLSLPLTSKGFDFEAEFVALVGRVKTPKLKLMEIPIKYVPRTVEEGKKIGFAHIFPQVYQAVRCHYFQKPIHLQRIRSLEWKTSSQPTQSLH